MKAWQYMGEQRPIQLNEIPDPVPSPTQVVIDMRAAGLCHSDLMYMENGDRAMPFLPMTQEAHCRQPVRELSPRSWSRRFHRSSPQAVLFTGKGCFT